MARATDEAGFSILEVMMALALFAIVIVGLATTTYAGFRLVGTSDTRQTATQVAHREMELLRSVPYASVGLVTSTVSSYNGEPVVLGGIAQPGPDAITSEGERFTVTRWVTSVDDPATTSTTEDYKRVTIVVDWRRQDGGNVAPTIVSSVFTSGNVGWTATV